MNVKDKEVEIIVH